MKTKRHTGIHRNARKHGGRVGDEANGRIRPRADEEDGVDFVEAQHGARHHCPQILGHVLDEGAKELGVFGILPACHVEDGPEEHWLGGVAFIGLFPAENREEGMEMLQEPGVIFMSLAFHTFWLT